MEKAWDIPKQRDESPVYHGLVRQPDIIEFGRERVGFPLIKDAFPNLSEETVGLRPFSFEEPNPIVKLFAHKLYFILCTASAGTWFFINTS